MSNTITSLANELNNSYPVFEANQLLTSTHLNQLRTYLDVQDRLSRVKLVGMGIVCGLEVSYDSNVISISGGTGVTSQGFLIEIPDGNYPKCALADYFDPESYPPFVTAAPTLTGQIPMYELLPPGPTTPTTKEVIEFNDSDFAGFLEDKVVVLFVEYENIDLETCLGDNCDDKGISRKFTIRRLLLNCDDVDAIIRSGYNVAYGEADPLDLTLDGSLNLRFNQNYAAIPAVSLIPHDTFPAEYDSAYQGLNTPEILQNRFEAIFPSLPTNPLRELDVTIGKAYKRFGPLLQNLVDVTQINDLQNVFNTYLTECETNNTVHYYYDFAKDVIKAYNEFFDGAFDLMAECCPSQDAFKRHLILGKVQVGYGCPEAEDACKPKLYRTHFIQSPIYNQHKDRLAEVRNNFKRLVEMISGFQTSHPTIAALKVTPSNEKQHLLEYCSIPFYYSISPLYKYWNYNLSKKCRSEWNLSYNADAFDVDNDSSQFPLAYCKDKHNFFRIEGLLNKPYTEMRDELEILKRKYQLEFDVMALKLQKGTDQPSHKANCGITDIKEDYLQLRNEIIAETKKYTWLLTKFFYFLSNSKEIIADFVGDGTDLGNAKKQRAARGPSEVLMNDDGLGTDDSGGQLETDADKVDAALAIFQDLLQSIDEVEELVAAMPICIENFNYLEFKNAFKDLQELSFLVAVSFENVIRSFYQVQTFVGLLIAPMIQNFIERFFLVNFGFIGSIYDLNDILRSHWDVKMKSLYFSYKHRLEALDNAKLFSNFAMHNPGIEHMAGVPKGGTFIMAYESEASPNVVLDFALHGKPCCCKEPFPMCNENAPKYPPFAKNVYAFLGSEKDDGVTVYIDVLEFAIDLNDPTEVLDIVEFPNYTTEQRATMKGIPKRVESVLLGRAVVEYRSTNLFDLGTDKFEFTVVNSIGETDTACVFVAKTVMGGNFILNMVKSIDNYFNEYFEETGDAQLESGGIVTELDGTYGNAYDYGIAHEYTGAKLHRGLEVATFYEADIEGSDNRAAVFIGKTRKRFKNTDALGDLSVDATAEDKKVYEKAVIEEYGTLMAETATEIKELDIQIGQTPKNPREALEFNMRNAKKINEKAALVAVYEDQAENLREIVQKQDLATDVDSDMYKYIDQDMRAQAVVINKYTSRVNNGFVAHSEKDGINATRKELFDSFKG